MGREAAVGRIREFVRRAEDMEMGVAGERRQGDARLGGIWIGRRTSRLRPQAPMRFSGHRCVPLAYSLAPTLIVLPPRKGQSHIAAALLSLPVFGPKTGRDSLTAGKLTGNLRNSGLL